MFKDILKTMKINHWIKNLVVLVPLLFSMKFNQPFLWLKSIIMAVSFCFMSSCVYTMNDLIDIKNDKNHPEKSKRPICSGRISKFGAVILLILLFSLSVILSLKLNIFCAYALLLYFLINIYYSLSLKNIPVIDAACIALGFIIRILSGCFVIGVEPSSFVVLMTFFTSLFCTFLKRRLEFETVDKKYIRNSIKNFDIKTLDMYVLMSAVLSVSFYFTHTLDTVTIERAGTKFLYITTIPFCLVVFRLLFLANNFKISTDPMNLIIKDKTIKILFFLYLIVLGFVMTILK